MGVRRVALIAGAVLAASLLAAVPASAAPVVRQATGANAAAITATNAAFEEEVGTVNCPAMSGCRRIVWDGVPDIRSDPAFMPEGQFRGVGALFTTPGTGVQVSADDNTADPPPFDDPDQIDFSGINPTYLGQFQPFSAQRLFTSIGSNVIDTRFVVAGTDTPADTNAFGVVFGDVNVAGPTTMQYFAPDGSSLGIFTVPATPGDETFSFLGVIFDAGERIARVRITQGGAPLAPEVNDLAPADLVVTDNFVFGEPQAQAAQAPDRIPPTLAITGVPKKQSLEKFLRGVNFSVDPNEESQIEVVLAAKAKKATLAANGDLVLASRSFDFSTATRTGKLKPKKSLVGKAKKFTVSLQVEAIDRSGNKATATRKVKVKQK
jgi:hypothetical protein